MYVLSEYEWDPMFVYGCFTTQEAAQQAADRIMLADGDGYTKWFGDWVEIDREFLGAYEPRTWIRKAGRRRARLTYSIHEVEPDRVYYDFEQN